MKKGSSSSGGVYGTALLCSFHVPKNFRMEGSFYVGMAQLVRILVVF